MAVGATGFLAGLLDTLSPNLHTLPLPWVDPFKPLALRDIAQVPEILSFLRLQIFGFLFTLQLPPYRSALVPCATYSYAFLPKISSGVGDLPHRSLTFSSTTPISPAAANLHIRNEILLVA
ncbi:hypothetical protein OIDMADRAFT_50472 [Oidiodendron maius Zn]|uniref:Uncharacterized protein n=1 Tax=Oidiodendron maius (strain Zn) TaxID=913774 RepID=A0A0C3HQW0_OIDMZ|nr:hypothetical protein OIDMADRAFT_50472 [Oidiodendron maius Zn]